jgi:adenosylmethionine-8-amino-7-oxononanoate aminotransferase
MFAGVTHQPAIDLAEKLVKASSPELSKVFFSDNGSTAVEVALKMSLQYWLQTGKPKKIKFIYLKGGYHGETLGALSVCGMSLFRGKFEQVLPQNLEVQGPDCLRCSFGLKRESCNAECFEPMEQTIEENQEAVAGVILEPLVQGAAGMKMYPPVYLKKLEDACKASGVHVIYDEVAVGFGRTGSLFVSKHHGLNPDFLCLSKGITSGYLPLAATLTTDEIYQAFYGDYESFKLFIHSHSYSANPLACAAANASLDLFEREPRLAQVAAIEAHLRDALEPCRALPGVIDVRAKGAIGVVQVDTLTRVDWLKQRFVEEGVWIRPFGDVIYVMPPFVIEPGDLTHLTNAMVKVIGEWSGIQGDGVGL